MDYSTNDDLDELLTLLNDIGVKKGRSILSNYDGYLHHIEVEMTEGFPINHMGDESKRQDEEENDQMDIIKSRSDEPRRG
jgi:hypothetical protein